MISPDASFVATFKALPTPFGSDWMNLMLYRLLFRLMYSWMMSKVLSVE
jgi:hypothetical protein